MEEEDRPNCTKNGPVTLTFDPDQTTRSVTCRNDWWPDQVTGHVSGEAVITATRHVCISDFRVYLLCLSGNKPIDPLKVKKLDRLKHGVREETFFLKKLRSHIQAIHVYKSHSFLPTTDFAILQGTKQHAVVFREAFTFALEHVLQETVPVTPRRRGIFVQYALMAWCRCRIVNGCMPCRNVVVKRMQEVKVRTECSLRLLSRQVALTVAQGSDPYMKSSEQVGGSRIQWLRCGGGLVQCRLQLPYKGIVRGEVVPVLADICNFTRYTVASVSLHLMKAMQEFVFSGSSKKDRQRGDWVVPEEITRVQLEGLAPQTQWQCAVMALHVPDTCSTDTSFPAWPFLSVRFFVRLKLKLGLCYTTMTCDAGCYLGTERSGQPVSKPTINLNRLDIFPADFIKRADLENLPFILLASTPRVQRESPASEDTPLLA